MVGAVEALFTTSAAEDLIMVGDAEHLIEPAHEHARELHPIRGLVSSLESDRPPEGEQARGQLVAVGDAGVPGACGGEVGAWRWSE